MLGDDCARAEVDEEAADENHDHQIVDLANQRDRVGDEIHRRDHIDDTEQQQPLGHTRDRATAYKPPVQPHEVRQVEKEAETRHTHRSAPPACIEAEAHAEPYRHSVSGTTAPSSTL